MEQNFREEIVDELDRVGDDHIVIKKVTKPPSRESIRKDGPTFQLDAAALSTDMRQYSGMTVAFGRRGVVNMVRGFFVGVIRIVAANDGKIADFNGDGMIAVFAGDDRVDRAVRAAGQCKWFVDELLTPRLRETFDGVQRISNEDRVPTFDAGFAVDEGVVLACGVGHDKRDDPVWVGSCVNTSAKLCKITRNPYSIAITREAFDRLNFRREDPFHDGWTVARESVKIGGLERAFLLNERSIPLD